MRLLFCIKALSSLGGGAERVFASVVNGLAHRGHDVTVLTFESATRTSFYPIDRGIKRHSCGAPGDEGARASLWRLRKSVHTLRPEVAIGFMPSCYAPLAFALTGSGIPVIASEHNVPARYRATPAKWHLIRMTPPLVRHFTAVSEQMRSEYPERLRRKMVVIPNPIQLPSNANADVVGRDELRTLLAVGRLHPQKDHLTLIRAFARIANEFPEWRLKIVGDGPERDKLEREIRTLDLSGRIALKDTTLRISEEYLGAQLYAMPSRYESYGLATAEAFAHGLPAIGFADCPGTNELIVHEKNGLLVDPADGRVDAMAAGLLMLLGNADKREALAKGAKRSWSGHELDSVLDRWEALLVER